MDSDALPRECLRAARSAPRWTHPKGKENSRQEEDGNDGRSLIRVRLRCLPELFGGQEADQQGTVHDGGASDCRRRLTFAAMMKSFSCRPRIEWVRNRTVQYPHPTDRSG